MTADVSVSTAPEPSRGVRLALRILQTGALAVVFAVSTHKAFELDRFLVSKELALHLTALLGLIVALPAIHRLGRTRIDLYLGAYVLLSAVSAMFATNEWLALRATLLSLSALAIFLVARAVSAAGLGNQLINGVALAVVAAAVTSLMQAYGIETDLFSINRSPGGTLGNRNFVAHVAAFGLPVLAVAALRARTALGYLTGATGIGVVVLALVLTRSRAAWLATAAMIIVFAFRAFRVEARVWRRGMGIGVLAIVGVVAALLIPNTLRWRSENPYIESVKGVANYEEGSGAGRLRQYGRSMRILTDDPLFGAGPGNWPVAYPRHAMRNDPSIDSSEPGTTFNPWPSSDWVAFVTERGVIATIALGLAMLGIMAVGLRIGDPLTGAGMLATVVAACVTGAFDAVLLLGLPTMIVWTAIGAMWPDTSATRPIPRTAVLVLIVCAAAGAARNTAQLIAMEIYSARSDRTSLTTAATIDPGNYRVQMRLARGGKGRERCEHARAAYSLFPNAAAARAAVRGCGDD